MADRTDHGEGSPGPLWAPSPDRIATAALSGFRERFAARIGRALPDFAALHGASVAHAGEFWAEAWDAFGVVGDRGERLVADPEHMPGARFLPDATLSFTENLLRRRDGAPAVIATDERGEDRVVSWAELADLTARLAGWLRAEGVGVGDRVAAWLPNGPEAVAAHLAAASIGAIWSSTSPDFGVRGVLDRFGQIEPVVLLAADGYRYAGREHDCLARLAELRPALPTVRRVLVVPTLAGEPDTRGIDDVVLLDDALAASPSTPLECARLPFDHPLAILFSSGTTGAPKCIVHRAGGILLKHLVEHRLHVDLRPGDRAFYFATTSWMMWNWLVSALASEATIVLYDGSPLHPHAAALFDLADRTGITLFGTSAKYLDTLRKEGVRPADTHSLATVRTITSTGSPLVAEGFDYVYEAIASDVHLASISGGTDLCGCLVAGDPTGAVWRGEIQAAGLGMAIEVWGDDGQPREPGVTGELVCTRPFPSMPLGFWGDADGSRYRSAYFERFPGVWTQGDFSRRTEHGGFVITGRSDSTLNPGGVRIGTAELYRQVELVPEVVEALAIGQQWDDDQRVVLFVRLRPGARLDDALREQIRWTVRTNCSPRHVPARIVAVSDLPRTRNGKLAELAVADVVHGREVRNREALANPEALDGLAELLELQS